MLCIDSVKDHAYTPKFLFPTILPCFFPYFQALRSKQLNAHWEECELVNYQYYMLWTEHIIFSGRNWQSTQVSAKLSNTFTHLLRANRSPLTMRYPFYCLEVSVQSISSPQSSKSSILGSSRPETWPNRKPILLYVSYFYRSLIVTTTHFRATSPYTNTHCVFYSSQTSSAYYSLCLTC